MKIELTAAVTNNLPLIIKTAALFLASLIVYFQDLLLMANEALQTELASYILALPFLIGYIVYRKRKILRTVVAFEKNKQQRFPEEMAGAILCFSALLLYLYGSYTFYSLALHLISLPIFIAGCILIIFNMQTLRTLAFPIALLLMLAVPPLEIAFLAGAMLSNVGSQIAFSILKFIGLPVELSYPQFAPVIVLHSASGVPLEFAIQVACSGIYSLLGFVVFASFAAYIIRDAFWKKLVVFFVGFPLIFFLNIVRITSIILIGYYFGYNIAFESFHIFGGWVLIFISTLFILFLSEKIFKLRIFSPKLKTNSCKQCGRSLKAHENFCSSCGTLLKFPNVKLSRRKIAIITALILGTTLVAYVRIPVLAMTQGPTQAAIQTPYGSGNSPILPEISNYTLGFMYRDVQFEEMYGQDAALIYSYVTRGSYPMVWVAIEIADVGSPLHNWEMCYYLQERSGEFLRLDLRDIQLLQNPQIIARFYSFQVIKSADREVRNNFTETILYWFTRAAFDTGSRVEWKFVKISVWIDAWDMDYNEIEKQLLPFGEAIANYWKPLESWSLISLTIGKYQGFLLATATSLLLIMLISTALRTWRYKRLNWKLYERLSKNDKLIFQAVSKASEEGRPTANAIASAYKKLTGRTIGQSELMKRMRCAERQNLLDEYIDNSDDNPVLIWKLNFKLRG